MIKMFKNLGVTLVILSLVVSFSGCGLTGGGEPEDPSNAISEGISNLFGTFGSASYEIALKGEAEMPSYSGELETTTFDITVSGAYDMSDQEAPVGNTKIVGEVDSSTASGSFDGELRISEENIYMILSELTGFDGAAEEEGAADFIAKWWKMEIPPGTFYDTGFPTSEEDLSEEDKQLKALIAETNFFSGVTSVGTEKVFGTKCYGYETELDEEATKEFIYAAGEIYGETPSESDKEGIDEMFSTVDLNLSAWVSSDDMTLRKIAATIKVDPKEEEGEINLDLAFSIGDLNKAVSVDEPADAEELDPMMMMLPMMMMGGGMGGGLEDDYYYEEDFDY